MTSAVGHCQPLRLILITVPVSGVDPAKAIYVDHVGFTAEQDHQVDESHRFVELIPPGTLQVGPLPSS